MKYRGKLLVSFVFYQKGTSLGAKQWDVVVTPFTNIKTVRPMLRIPKIKKQWWHQTFKLKALDTIGNCQRPVFSLAESQHIHKLTNLWKVKLNRSSKLRDNNERKSTLVTRCCALSADVWFRDLKFYKSVPEIQFDENNIFFSKSTSLQREPFLTMFYTINNYFE